MRSCTTVYRADGTPIEVVTIENRKTTAAPASVAADIAYEKEKLVESKPQPFSLGVAKSEPDR